MAVKAVLCRSYGPPEQLTVAEVEPPTPGKRQVVIAVKAAGVNFPDTLIIQGKYQLQPPLPFAPGSEVAGIVTAVGEDVDPHLLGRRVMAFTAFGGFAEQIAGDADAAIPIPDAVAFPTAAAFGMTYGTAFHALKDRARLANGEMVLVLGAAGGVGLAAVELAHVMGARVIAAASTDEKLAVCQGAGADETINYAREDLKERIKALTAGRGADVVFDPVGGAYSEAALRGTAWNGRYLVVGFAAGEIPRIPLNLPLLKGCAIVGVFWGSFAAREAERNRANMLELLGWVEAGRLRPLISATYPLADAAQALRALLERRVAGKVVLLTDM
jgi:NADPH2:quinone reductase